MGTIKTIQDLKQEIKKLNLKTEHEVYNFMRSKGMTNNINILEIIKEGLKE